ncbi:MAG: hypothetical protein JRF02_09740 [Deltaproteobacteria bacterium]|jgi:hypothetical protein|nr:hypothetical protein [Deltaproteobacteria bacterium]
MDEAIRILIKLSKYSLFLLSSLLITLGACASLPEPPAEITRLEWSEILIVPARFAPESNFEAFAIGNIKGAAKGATIGALVGTAHIAAFAALGGPFAPIIAPYLAYGCLTGIFHFWIKGVDDEIEKG